MAIPRPGRRRRYVEGIAEEHTGIAGGVVVYRRRGRIVARRALQETTIPESDWLPQMFAFRTVDAAYALLTLDQVWRWNYRGYRYGRIAYQEFMRHNLPRAIKGLPLQMDSGETRVRLRRFDRVE